VGLEVPKRNATGKPITSIGIPQFPVDIDGVVRKYRRRYWVVEHETSPRPKDSMSPKTDESFPYEMDSLPHALVKACKAAKACLPYEGWQREEDRHSDDETIMKFVAGQFVFRPTDARSLLEPIEREASGKSDNNGTDIVKALRLRPHSIVIIGGTYKGARDVYRTPLGDMAGVELLAHAVETDLHEGIDESSEWLKLLAELVAALLLVRLWAVLRHHIPVWVVFLLSPLGVLLASLLVGEILFHHGIWLDSVAIFVGVVLHQTTEELALIEEK